MHLLAFLRGAVLALITVLSLSLASVAQASVCAPWPVLQDQIANSYGESTVFVGLTASAGQEVAVFGAPQGTWTLIVRQADGTACVLAYGMTWAAIDASLTPPLPGSEN
jgi:hypothetical protein